MLSGPSTGVVAAQAIGRLAGFPDLITFDMGGTSSDVALLENGQCRLASEAVVHGYPIKAPMLDIHTVGAGGGSIAYVDSGGLLKVGPRSAGADPGPVCYGRGNDEPTVTDANVVLQTLNPTHLLGGRMAVRRDLAKAAIGRLAEQLGLDPMATAQGIISVVTANMAKAIRVISVQRGHDPRDYALVAFGGAGPLHAARLARELDMTRILVPRNPGILCAMGLLLTDLRADFAVTRLTGSEPGPLGGIEAAFAGLERSGRTTGSRRRRSPAASPPAHPHGRHALRRAELRARGRRCPTGPSPRRRSTRWARASRPRTSAMYGFVAEGEAIQIVTFRVEATGLVAKAEFKPRPDAGPDASGAIIGRREVWLPEAGGFVVLPDLRPRRSCDAGNRIAGPAIVEQMDATTVILPGMTAHVEPYLNLILEIAMSMPVPSAEATLATSVDPITVEVIGSAFSSIAEEMGEALVRASYSTNIKERRDCSTALFDIAGQHALPGRAHPDASRQLHRHHPAHHEAQPAVGDAARRRLHRQRRLSRAAARTCPTSCWPSRSSSTARSPPGRSTPPTTPISPTAATPTSTRKACASRRSGSIGRASCRRTCRS